MHRRSLVHASTEPRPCVDEAPSMHPPFPAPASPPSDRSPKCKKWIYILLLLKCFVNLWRLCVQTIPPQGARGARASASGRRTSTLWVGQSRMLLRNITDDSRYATSCVLKPEKFQLRTRRCIEYFACAIAWVCEYIYIFSLRVFSGPQHRRCRTYRGLTLFLCAYPRSTTDLINPYIN